MPFNDIYRITSVLKVETIIRTSFAASPIVRPGIIVIMYVETFRMDAFHFIGIKRHNVTSH